jgi:hypothetical protein
MRRAYYLILSLYPAEYRANFGQEMLEVFETAAERSRREGSLARLRFAGRELTGVLAGLTKEWAARSATPHSYVSSRCALQPEPEMPSGIVETQQRLKWLIGHMEFAIAHHDFPSARRYSYEERAVREHLTQLMNEYRRTQHYRS